LTDIFKRSFALLKDAGIPGLHFVEFVPAGLLVGRAVDRQAVQLGRLGLDLLRQRLLPARVTADAVEDRTAMLVDRLEHAGEQHGEFPVLVRPRLADEIRDEGRGLGQLGAARGKLAGEVGQRIVVAPGFVDRLERWSVPYLPGRN